MWASEWRGLRVLVSLLVLSLSSAASADEVTDDGDAARARELASMGFERVKDRDWQKALDLYNRAYALYPAPTLAVRQARCLIELKRFVDAAAAYQRAIDAKLKPDASQAMRRGQREARDELAALEPRIPRLKVVLAGSDAAYPPPTVLLDGEPLPPDERGVFVSVDIGRHEVVVSALDGRQQSKSIEMDEGERTKLVVSVPPTTSTSNPMQVGFGWGAVGLGVVGLVVGIVAGVDATNTDNGLADVCENGACPASAESDIDSFRTMRTVSTVGYIVGAVGAAGGATLLLIAASGEARDEAPIEIRVAASGLLIRGHF